MQIYKIGANQAGQRLDKFLKKFLPEAGSGFLYKMLRKKNITLNGKKAEGSELLNLNDTISFYFSDETYRKFQGLATASGEPGQDSRKTRKPGIDARSYHLAYQQLKGIQIVFENEHILILNKPAGVLSQKATPEDISLNEWMIGYLLQKNAALISDLNTFRPSVCNRLDRNTSGLVLCGKSLSGTQYLSKMIHDRCIRKFYHTICLGKIEAASLIEGYLSKDPHTNRVTVTKQDTGEQGSYIRTAYRPLKHFPQGITLLEVELITGKPHQIRAHLASTGHPVLGDEKYGDPEINRRYRTSHHIRYQLLHACRLEFPSDSTAREFGVFGRVISIEDPEIFRLLQH